MRFRGALSLGGVLVGAVLFAGCSSGQFGGAPSALTAAVGGALAASGGGEVADVSNQGGPAAGVYAPGGASLIRQPDGLRVRLSMPAPEPGTYAYPPPKTEGHPEIFTLWAFVFNYPDKCSPPSCGSDDLGVDKPARGGAYNAGGHPVSGSTLTFAGHVRVGETPFDHPVITMAPLEAPSTAEVHLAVAPHGGLDPASLPRELRVPAGNSTHWWVAIFP